MIPQLSERFFRWTFFSSRRTYAIVFLTTVTLFLLTTHYASAQVSDTQGAIWPAYVFVHHRTFTLDHIQGLPDNSWFFRPQGPQGPLVAARMMGVVLAGVPICALLAWTPLTPAQLNAVNAAVLTALAITVLFAALRRLVPSRCAFAAVTIVAFGTSVWTVAAAETWPHTVDVLSLSLVFLALSRDRVGWAGIALIPGLWSRPHLAIVALILGVGLSITRKSWRPLFGFGLPAAGGFAVLLIWNHVMFGGWQLLGTYSNKVGALQSSSGGALNYLESARNALLSPREGLLLLSPVVALAGYWILKRSRVAPDWTALALVSGLLYEAVQLKIEEYSGGANFIGSRYTLELLMLGLPIAVVCYQPWAAGHPLRRFLTSMLAGGGVAIFAVCAFTGHYRDAFAYRAINMTGFFPWRVVLLGGSRGAVVATIAVTLFVVFAVARYLSLVRGRPVTIVAPRGAPAVPDVLEPVS